MCFESLSDNHTPTSPEVFLDTTIHCSRLKGSFFRPRIAKVLELFRWKGTSTFTQMEFGNIVLAQAQYFLKKFKEEGSFEKVLDFIGNRLPHKLHAAKVLWSFNLISQQGFGNTDEERTARVIISLRRLMKQGVGFVEETCDKPIAHGTACYWA